jgi:hypothetical protein
MIEIVESKNTGVADYQRTYLEYKAELDAELAKTAESFVKIGYLLKVARDTNILYESGYKNVVEFAQAEYNIDKTQVSRFIKINDEFSEGGYSDRLEERYRGFGYAKLSIMLQLPESINEELTPEYSKKEIQALKDEVDAENKVTDIERMLEAAEEPEVIEKAAQGSKAAAVQGSTVEEGGAAAVPENTVLESGAAAVPETNLQIAIKRLGEEIPELYIEVHKALSESPGERGNTGKIKEIMMPDGAKIYMILIRGIGRCMLSLKEEEDVKLINVRSGEKEVFTWEELTESWMDIMHMHILPRQSWEMIYGREYPEVAPVQQEQESRKESKVVKAKEHPEQKPEVQQEVERHKAEQNAIKAEQNSEIEESTSEMSMPVQESIEGSETCTENPGERGNMQVEGQQSIEEYPEYMPDEYEKTPENKEQISRKAYEQRKKTYEEGVENNIQAANRNIEDGIYEIAKADLLDAIRYLDALIELERIEILENEGEGK